MQIEGVAVRVTVEACRIVYNKGRRFVIFELLLELVVSAMELAGETLVRSDEVLDLSEKRADFFFGNLACWGPWGRTGDSVNGD